MKHLSLIISSFALLSASAFAQTIIPQPQNNMSDTIITGIVFLIAVAVYLLTKNTIQQKDLIFPLWYIMSLALSWQPLFST